ncbi:MAG: dihydroorotate dehydrogenase electron transfer subunit [Actinomycetota bacterium]|nr:dihydroorotate dehydrogenase electron transfer subunit [Rubrobacteraceae bacterium]MDQ3498452.1 dihydroorotate dehydrogenase electron transfer subunit [Actinomycetota bacterium]
MKFYKVKVEEREELGSYTLLRYRWSDGPVEPGQFVMARAAGYPETLDPFLARPFSFYDYDGEMASLLFEVRGRGTALLDLAPTIEVTAPLGKGFRIEPGLGRAALLGGGIGVAPLKILGRRLDAAGVPHDVFLGFADAKSAVVAREFQGAEVATMDGSEGTHGTVLDPIDTLEDYGAVYSCGPNPMLAAVKLAAGENSLCQLSVEERMGCGNGSCNGCVVPVRGGGYIRSCIEGPVFRAEVLAW